MLIITTLGTPRRSTTKRSFFWVARLMICPNCVRAVRAETMLVIGVGGFALRSLRELIDQFSVSLSDAQTTALLTQIGRAPSAGLPAPFACRSFGRSTGR